MQCPICQVELKMSERHGVEIDYCPKCRGVWLDRGELDKIIDKATPPVALPDPAPRPESEPVRDRGDRYREDDRREDRSRYDDRPDDRYRDDRYRDDGYRKGYKPRKRKSILSEIFDFD